MDDDSRMTWETPLGDRVEIYPDAAGEWRWRVRARNGEPVGGGEGHPDRGDAVTAAMRYHGPGETRDVVAELPTAWFAFTTTPPVGATVLVDGIPHTVAATSLSRQPGRVVVRLTRSAVNRG